MSQGPGAAESAPSLLRELDGRAGPVRGRWWLPLAAGLVLAALGLAVLAAGPGLGSLAVMTGLLFIAGGAAVALNPAYAASSTACWRSRFAPPRGADPGGPRRGLFA